MAVKALREDFSQDVAFRERFRQEAKAAANLSHPNIVTVHDFGLDQKHLFIVMEYMPGTDLKTLIKQKERFSVSEALELMIQGAARIHKTWTGLNNFTIQKLIWNLNHITNTQLSIGFQLIHFCQLKAFYMGKQAAGL